MRLYVLFIDLDNGYINICFHLDNFTKKKELPRRESLLMNSGSYIISTEESTKHLRRSY